MLGEERREEVGDDDHDGYGCVGISTSAISSTSITTSATFRQTVHTTAAVNGGNLRNPSISSSGSGIGGYNHQREIEDNSIRFRNTCSATTTTAVSCGVPIPVSSSSSTVEEESRQSNNIILSGSRGGENGGASSASGYFGNSSSGGGGISAVDQNNYSSNSNNNNHGDSDNIIRRGSGGSRRRLLRSRRRANIFHHQQQQLHNNNQKERIMASRGGPTVEGTDGTDFMHRQRVASQYQQSALNKSRLKTCIFFHIILFFALLLKLVPYILDRLDVFVLELEELEVPKPLKWEFWYCVSLPVAFIGLSAIRRNNIQAMQIYLGGTIANAIVPVLLGMYTYFGDVYTYVSTRSLKNVQVWQGYPYGVLWYIFMVIALQIHVFSIIFASKLVTAWRLKGSAKKAE